MTDQEEKKPEPKIEYTPGQSVVFNCPEDPNFHGKTGKIGAFLYTNEEGDSSYTIILDQPAPSGKLCVNVLTKYFTSREKNETPKLYVGKKVPCIIAASGMMAVGVIVDLDDVGDTPAAAIRIDYMLDQKENWFGPPWPAKLAVIPVVDIMWWN